MARRIIDMDNSDPVGGAVPRTGYDYSQPTYAQSQEADAKARQGSVEAASNNTGLDAQSLWEQIMGKYRTGPTNQTAAAQQPSQQSQGGGGATVPSGPSSFFGNIQRPTGGLPGAPPPPSQFSPLSSLSFGSPPPTYQAYQFTQQGIQPTVLAGQAPQMPTFNPAPVSQFQPSGANYDSYINQLIQGMMANVTPNTAALKESAKETLGAQNQQALDAVLQSAARRGTLGGGVELQNELEQRQNFGGDLTKAYRDIDIAAQDAAFRNSQSGAQTLSGIAAQQAQTAQGNYQTTLQGQMAQAQLDQIKGQFQQAAAQFGLDYAQAAFGQQLAVAQQNLAREQAQSGANQGAADLALQNYLGVNNLNLNRAQAQSGDELARWNAAWQRALGMGQYDLSQQQFGLDLSGAQFNEWLQKAQMDAQAAQAGAAGGRADRSLDLQEAQMNYERDLDYLRIVLGLTE